MITIFYRKTDRLVVGYAYPRKTEQQTREAVAVEASNIVQSELGGVPSDYATVEAIIPPGMQPVINLDNTVSFEPKTLHTKAARLKALKDIAPADWTLDEMRELLGLIS
jgi:hypothetical protein